MGPKVFEGDSFYHVPYAKHIRRFDYGEYPHPGWEQFRFLENKFWYGQNVQHLTKISIK